MTDKERILMWLVNRLYANALYSRDKISKWRDIQPSIISNDNPLQVGDLVTTQTTITPNDFIVVLLLYLNLIEKTASFENTLRASTVQISLSNEIDLNLYVYDLSESEKAFNTF